MKRTQKSQEEACDILKTFQSSGKTQKDFCKEQGIPVSTFSYWLKRQRKIPKDTLTTPGQKAFVRVKPIAQPSSFSSNPLLRLDFPSGIRLSLFCTEITHGLKSIVESLAKL